jgi:hypothetical protein
MPRITPLTDLGRPAVQAYAARSGQTEEEYVRQLGEHELAVGDCAWFRADTPHHYIALRAARALNLIGTP